MSAVKLPELLVVLLIFAQFGDHIEDFFGDFFGDGLENLVLLQGLTVDVQRQVVGVDDTANEVEVLGHNIVEGILDEHSPYVELDIGLFVVVLVDLVPVGSLGDVKE